MQIFELSNCWTIHRPNIISCGAAFAVIFTLCYDCAQCAVYQLMRVVMVTVN